MPITIAGARLIYFGVWNMREAHVPHTKMKCFARLGRTNTRRERAQTLRIGHALREQEPLQWQLLKGADLSYAAIITTPSVAASKEQRCHHRSHRCPQR